MSVIISMESDEPAAASAPLIVLCPQCGRQKRIDERCDCEMLFYLGYKKKSK
ncbi:MAG: hypothetical protein M3258_00045 [Thermoproteota archaeon]|jgi:hypothetical protein|nr:hypothetical protein [Thermoproteota archaeon]